MHLSIDACMTITDAARKSTVITCQVLLCFTIQSRLTGSLRPAYMPCQEVKQPISQSVNQSVNESANQPVLPSLTFCWQNFRDAVQRLLPYSTGRALSLFDVSANEQVQRLQAGTGCWPVSTVRHARMYACFPMRSWQTRQWASKSDCIQPTPSYSGATARLTGPGHPSIHPTSGLSVMPVGQPSQ